MHCTVNDMEIKQSIGICISSDASVTSALSSDDGSTDATSGADAASGDGSNGVVVEAGAPEGGTGDGGADADAGDAGVMSEYGATMYNAEGDDDDCKYHVSWKSTAVKENAGVTFDVNAIRRVDGQPATGANVVLEVFLNVVHPTPSVNITNTESPGGNYKVGPVIFDAPGKWTVRFHFYETCSDLPEDSPHGHAAFYVNVP